VYARQGASPALLVCPGWDDDGKDQFDAMNELLSAQGWRCLRAGLPDESWPADIRARTTREDSMQQLLGDHDQLVSHASVDPARVGVLGFSYGGYAAALLTSLRPVGFMVLRSPAIYPDDEWRTPKQLLDQDAVDAVRQHRLAPGENLVLDCCCRFRGPVLLIESEQDEVIPRTVIDNYEAAFRQARTSARWMLAGADHRLTQASARDVYVAGVVSWLVRQAEEAPRTAMPPSPPEAFAAPDAESIFVYRECVFACVPQRGHDDVYAVHVSYLSGPLQPVPCELPPHSAACLTHAEALQQGRQQAMRWTHERLSNRKARR
jgi:dienelactone hydrolase